jgi:hypothetical protein
MSELARRLTRLHHSGPATGESEDWYAVPVSVMNEALAALERAERIEDAVRTWRDDTGAAGKALDAIMAALADAPAPGRKGSGHIEVIRQLAYRGKEGCTSPLCTRLDLRDTSGPCYGWHCARCHEPCSYQGHENCRVATPAKEGR